MKQENEQVEAQQLADVHAALIHHFLTMGHLPAMDHIVSSLQITSFELTRRLNALAHLHGLVLHPHAAEPWVVHPFSTTPTLHYVEGSAHGW